MHTPCSLAPISAPQHHAGLERIHRYVFETCGIWIWVHWRETMVDFSRKTIECDLRYLNVLRWMFIRNEDYLLDFIRWSIGILSKDSKIRISQRWKHNKCITRKNEIFIGHDSNSEIKQGSLRYQQVQDFYRSRQDETNQSLWANRWHASTINIKVKNFSLIFFISLQLIRYKTICTTIISFKYISARKLLTSIHWLIQVNRNEFIVR